MPSCLLNCYWSAFFESLGVWIIQLLKNKNWFNCFINSKVGLWIIEKQKSRTGNWFSLIPTSYRCARHRVQRRCVCRKPVENLWKNGLFWSRCSFVTHSIYRKQRDWGLARSAYSIKYGLRASVALRATCCAPARLWLAVIDFQNGYQQSRSWSDKKRRNRLQ